MDKKLKTYEACCKKLGKDPVKELPYSKPKNGFQKALNGYAKLFLIAEALNEGWVPDWGNDDQWKYYPWMWVKPNTKNPSGFGLSYYVCDVDRSYSSVGSRLCFKSRELAEYAGKQFSKVYEEAFLIEK
jgi:hypothetical protein